MENRTDQNIDIIIKASIRECLKINTQFKPTDTLVLCVYSVLKGIYIQNKKRPRNKSRPFDYSKILLEVILVLFTC